MAFEWRFSVLLSAFYMHFQHGVYLFHHAEAASSALLLDHPRDCHKGSLAKHLEVHGHVPNLSDLAYVSTPYQCH